MQYLIEGIPNTLQSYEVIVKLSYFFVTIASNPLNLIWLVMPKDHQPKVIHLLFTMAVIRQDVCSGLGVAVGSSPCAHLAPDPDYGKVQKERSKKVPPFSEIFGRNCVWITSPAVRTAEGVIWACSQQ